MSDSSEAEGQASSLQILRQLNFFSFIHSCGTLDHTSLLGVVRSAWKSGVKIVQFTGHGVPKSQDQWEMAVN